MCRPVEPKPPNWTANKKVAGLPTFVVGRRPVDSQTDSGGEVVTAPTLAKAKALREQVPSQDNPGPSALAQKDDKVAPRVGRYLGGGDPPPPQIFFDESITIVRHLEKVFLGGENDMTDVDLAATSSCPRTAGPLTWSTRRGKSVWRRYGGVSGRTTDVT
ncbi:hypothetical protein BHM03_00037636 [Ensete ventricosum]|nr:hypothetical protein BHM03_00037636 [Ensete ventricosum]